MGSDRAPGRRVRDDVPRTNGRQVWVVVAAVVANLAFLVPFGWAWKSAGEQTRALNASFAEKCGRALPRELDVSWASATLGFERPYVLRLTWEHTSTVVLCQYDPGDGDDQPAFVVRAWVAER